MPIKLQSDQGPEFANHVVRELLELVRVRHSFSSPYTPTAQGSVERSHRTIESLMKKKFSEKQFRDWDLYVPETQFFLNTSLNTGTGFSPFELLYGFRVRFPLELAFPEYRDHIPFTEADRESLLQYQLRQRQEFRDQIELT